MIRRRLGRALDVVAAVGVTVGLLGWPEAPDPDPDEDAEELGTDWPW